MRKASLLNAPFNWREVPFVRLLIPLLSGIMVSFQTDLRLPDLPLLILVLLLFLSLFAFRKIAYRHRMWYGLLLNVALILFGFQLSQQQNERNADDHFSTQLQDTSTMVVQVIDLPTQTATKWKLFTKVTYILKDSVHLQPVSGRLLVYLPLDSTTQHIQYGQRLLLHGKMQPILPPRNPEAFDFQRYMHFQNIHYQHFAKTDFFKILEEDASFSLYKVALNLRKRALNTLQTYVTTADELAIAQALILGYKANLSEEIKDQYAGTGAIHVLAVSGLHVGFIAAGLYWILGRIRLYGWRWKAIQTGLTIAGIWIFALLTGAGPSVLRASTMFTIMIVGASLSRHSSIYNSIAASAFLLLLFNPYLLAQVGFQLSYLAVLGIVFFQPRIYKMLYLRTKVLDYLWTLIAVGLAAQLTTFPLSVYYFHQFPVYFWLSGLVVVPMAGLILTLGFGLLLFSWLPFVAGLFGYALWACIWMMNFCIEQIRHFPFSLWEGLWMNSFEVWMWYGGLLLIALGLSWRKMIFFLLATACILFATSAAAWRKIQQQAQQEVVIYDVYKHTVVDLISGQQVYTLFQQPLDESRVRFATEQYRWSKGIRTQHFLPLQDTTFQKDDLVVHRHLIQFYDLRLAFFQDLESPPEHPFSCNILLVHHTKRFDPKSFDQFYLPEWILFDGSIPSWKVEQWRLACQEKGYQTHVTSTDGAFLWKDLSDQD